MKKILQIILLVGLSFSSYAQDALLDSANQAYINTDYNQAIDQYQSVLDQGLVSPELYYNLGNSYYKTRSYTKAIINYERAKLLAPNDEDIQFNLELARQHTVDDIQPLPRVFIVKWWDGLLSVFTLDQWTWVSVASFLVFLGFLAVYFFSKTTRNKRLGFSLALLTIVISILSFNFAASHERALKDQKYAIVTQASVTVKGSPSAGGTSLFLIHEGLKVEIMDTLGEWLEVRLEDGNQGWLEANSIERI